MDEREQILIVRAKQRDPRAFEILVGSYSRTLLGLVFNMLGNMDDAQDVYQEALLSAYKALPKFTLKSEFSTWLYRIVVNKALNFRRRARSRPEQSDNDALPVALTHTRTPEREFLETEFQQQVLRALDALSRHERTAWTLCHDRELKIREAAAMMQCSEGAIKSYMFRARKKLKQNLKSYLQEDTNG